MARVRVELPADFQFETEIPVRVTDLNYGGHIGNDAVLSIAHEARVQFLASHGWTEENVDGVGLILTDAGVVYATQGHYGQTIRARVAVTHVSRAGCEMVYVFTDKDNGEEIARAKTGVAFFDYEKGKVVRTPDTFRALAT